MLLHVTVQEGGAGIIRDKVHFDDLVLRDVYDILHDARRRGAGEVHQLETVAMQVHRVHVAAVVVEDEPIALAAFDRQGIGIRPGLPIDGPVIEPTASAWNLLRLKFEGAVR